jgi:hypothetical protein
MPGGFKRGEIPDHTTGPREGKPWYHWKINGIDPHSDDTRSLILYPNAEKQSSAGYSMEELNILAGECHFRAEDINIKKSLTFTIQPDVILDSLRLLDYAQSPTYVLQIALTVCIDRRNDANGIGSIFWPEQTALYKLRF